jgi:hypothetical protein
MNVEDLRRLCRRQSGRGQGGIVRELTPMRVPPCRVHAEERSAANIRSRLNCKRVVAQLILVAVLTTVLFTGCVTPPNARTDLLNFLHPGKTTREEVLLKLGQPSASFEQERIFTYRIGQYGEQGYFIISPKVVLPAQGASWQNVHFSLVIVFDEQGRLQNHKLIRVD